MIGIVIIVGSAGICDALPRSTVRDPYVTTAVPPWLPLPPLPVGEFTSTGCAYVRVTGWLAQVVQTDVTVVTGAWGSVVHGTVIVNVTGAVQSGSVQTVVMTVTVFTIDFVLGGDEEVMLGLSDPVLDEMSSVDDDRLPV